MTTGKINSYVIQKCVLMAVTSATATDTQRYCPGLLTWGSRATRTWTTNLPLTLSFLTVEVTTNNNTSDGATITQRRANIATGMIVTFDQAAGNFQDDTNSAFFNQAIEMNWFYSQGDNSVITLGVSVMAEYA